MNATLSHQDVELIRAELPWAADQLLNNGLVSLSEGNLRRLFHSVRHAPMTVGPAQPLEPLAEPTFDEVLWSLPWVAHAIKAGESVTLDKAQLARLFEGRRWQYRREPMPMGEWIEIANFNGLASNAVGLYWGFWRTGMLDLINWGNCRWTEAAGDRHDIITPDAVMRVERPQEPILPPLSKRTRHE